MKKEKRVKANDYREVASRYAELALQIKELEKQAKPLKEELVSHATALDLETLDLGAVVIDKRIKTEARYQVSPSIALETFMERGYDVENYFDIKPKVLKDEADKEFAWKESLGYDEILKIAYAIRLS